MDLNYNKIFDNYEYGCYNNGADVDATHNWWGASNGPSGGVSDPVTGRVADGTGDRISSNVQFDPFCTDEICSEFYEEYPNTPEISDPGASIPTGMAYTVNWTDESASGATIYLLQEDTHPNFLNPQEFYRSGISDVFQHTVLEDTNYYYRVRSENENNGLHSVWSDPVDILVQKSSGIAEWTVMVYMGVDNNREGPGWDDLAEMESIGSSDKVNFVVQFDPRGDGSTYRYYLEGASHGWLFPYFSDDIVATLPETNMSLGVSLSGFVNWATDNYSAENYMLILYDHGDGWRNNSRGTLVDDTSGSVIMTNAAIADALSYTEKIDILGFDGCVMQMIETAYALGNNIDLIYPPDYMIGSETFEYGDGWPYDIIFGDIKAWPELNPADFCLKIVNAYVSWGGLSNVNLSVLKLNEYIDDAPTIINAFSTALLNSNYQSEIASARFSAQRFTSVLTGNDPMIKDLYHFAQIINANVPDCQTESQEVMDFVSNIVLYHDFSGIELENSHGLSIYLPDTPSDYNMDYFGIPFDQDTIWSDFLSQQVDYRALFVGTDYNGVAQRHILDAQKMNDLFDHCKYGLFQTGFSSAVNLVGDYATKSEIYSWIDNYLGDTTDKNDILLFYMGCHGGYSSVLDEYVLAPYDYDGTNSDKLITVSDLEDKLSESSIGGAKVIVILNSCHTGGFIGKNGDLITAVSPEEFDNAVINTFVSKDLTQPSNRYEVITACHSSETSNAVENGEAFTWFAKYFLEGCNYEIYSAPIPADNSPKNGKVGLQEIYQYTYDHVLSEYPDQHVQVHPVDSDFTIVEY
ncbi:MAG TPA: hypothetical protein DEQ09_06520 [Bacteroidales bacterium]|nr:hypothetical protein [Bacteroidales bacterium]